MPRTFLLVKRSRYTKKGTKIKIHTFIGIANIEKLYHSNRTICRSPLGSTSEQNFTFCENGCNYDLYDPPPLKACENGCDYAMERISHYYCNKKGPWVLDNCRGKYDGCAVVGDKPHHIVSINLKKFWSKIRSKSGLSKFSGRKFKTSKIKPEYNLSFSIWQSYTLVVIVYCESRRWTITYILIT